MSDVQTIRPNATGANTNWAIVGGATAHGVLSDSNFATYVSTSSATNILSLNGPNHTPAAGHERDRFQVVAYADAVTGGYLRIVGRVGAGFGSDGTVFIPNDAVLPYGPGFYTFPTGEATGALPVVFTLQRTSGDLLVAELLVQVWSHLAPTFTAEVHDGAGVNRDAGIVSDTSRPVFVFDSPNYDGLVSRSWTLEVRTVPGGVVVFSASGTGTPPSVQSDPLPNGDYEADLQIFSTIRGNDPYGSTVENVTFEVAFVAPASPVLTVTPVLSPPAMDVDWTSDTPTATAWDVDADVVTELRRTDCNGTDTVIYVAQTGIGAATYLDRFMSLSYNGVFCGEEDHVCQVCYEARYWGEVDGVLVATDWSTEVCDSVSNPNPGEAWIRGGESGDLNICPDESYGLARPFGVFQPIAGGMPTVITATPGGRNYTLSIPTNNEADTVILLAILAQAIVFYQPVEQADLWLAPDSHSVQVTKVGRNRMTDVPFVAVNPQPVVDPSSFF